MKWFREAGWFVAIGFVVVYFFWLRPAKWPKPDDTKALIEQHRTEAAERQARLDQELARIDLETTQRLLKQVGRAYREHLASEKKPPQAADFMELMEVWKSHRDGQPFVIQWGVDLTKLAGGANLLLAWEEKGAVDGSRCVLMADGETTKVVTKEEFDKLPKAK
ncbi:MAG TPA: hypothetical protein VKD71_15105 [Gemmataceae bacterium]|nr:hypothetical protein [Gemmataceae bacterium]